MSEATSGAFLLIPHIAAHMRATAAAADGGTDPSPDFTGLYE